MSEQDDADDIAEMASIIYRGLPDDASPHQIATRLLGWVREAEAVQREVGFNDGYSKGIARALSRAAEIAREYTYWDYLTSATATRKLVAAAIEAERDGETNV